MLDISGGDSFSDIYGAKRFQGITQLKRLALDLGTPLILLPQTYGPFSNKDNLEIARNIVRGASMAWSRDPRNFDSLKELLGQTFDPERHRSGVDVAFLLPKSEPADVSPKLKDWIRSDRSSPVIGFNVSGLIYNQGEEASRQFGFRGDYRDIVIGALKRFLSESQVRILLVPHVLAKIGNHESDPQACHDVMKQLGDEARVQVVNQPYNATEMKWVISHLDFFCGTRMHSTIAALSSGIPTSAIAYSKKTLGVFETCGQGGSVTDPRKLDADQCIEEIWGCWLAKDKNKACLGAELPTVTGRAQDQINRIVDHVSRLRTDRLPRSIGRPRQAAQGSAGDGRGLRN